jgi:hypothetical protein
MKKNLMFQPTKEYCNKCKDKVRKEMLDDEITWIEKRSLDLTCFCSLKCNDIKQRKIGEVYLKLFDERLSNLKERRKEIK